MEVKINGTPKEIADFLREIGNLLDEPKSVAPIIREIKNVASQIRVYHPGTNCTHSYVTDGNGNVIK